MKHILITTIAAVVLVGCGPKAPDISIHEAARNGNIEVVKQYIAAGVDVNAKNSFGMTPLHYAAGADHKEIAELLIAKGADVNAKNESGSTPLFGVIDGEIVELLIAKGADVNAKSDDGKTPLDWAIRRKHPETADLLRKHGGKTGEELKSEGK
jgi:ankyrin repeat protein